MVLRLENLDAKEISFKKLPAAKILCALQQKKIIIIIRRRRRTRK